MQINNNITIKAILRYYSLKKNIILNYYYSAFYYLRQIPVMFLLKVNVLVSTPIS